MFFYEIFLLERPGKEYCFFSGQKIDNRAEVLHIELMMVAKDKISYRNRIVS